MIFQLISLGLITLGCYNNIKLDPKNYNIKPIKFWFEVLFLSIVGVVVIFSLAAVVGDWTINLLEITEAAKSKCVSDTVILIISIMYCAGVSIYYEDPSTDSSH